jgi:hypothetical protein
MLHTVSIERHIEKLLMKRCTFSTVKESIDGAKSKLIKKLKIYFDNTPTNP